MTVRYEGRAVPIAMTGESARNPIPIDLDNDDLHSFIDEVLGQPRRRTGVSNASTIRIPSQPNADDDALLLANQDAIAHLSEENN